MDCTFTGVDEVGAAQLFGFGMELTIDMDADPDMIRDAMSIGEFAIQLVEQIGMKRFGPPQVVHFGHANPVTSGYTLLQLIETSLISAHFSEGRNTAHINVFSCQWFDAQAALRWIARFFRATGVQYRVSSR